MEYKKIILIPSYEPDDKLIKLLQKLHKEDLDVILVNDGSGPKYKDIFDEAKTLVNKYITYPTNMGKGHALKEGLKYIKKNYKDNYVVTTMDSDGQHTIKDALKLSNLAYKNKNALILGKRVREKNVPLRSRLGNGITKFVFELVTHEEIYDTQTGLRSFSNQLMEYMLSIDGKRFEYEMNVLLYLKRNEIDVIEEKIETIYINKNSGSHFHAIKDSFKIYKNIFKFSLSSLFSFLIDYILYSIIIIASGNIILSNVGARIISATFNYNFNRKIVFKDDKDIRDTIIKYILLAIFILIVNTTILSLLVHLGMNKFLSKLLVEVLLFILSFLVQKFLIFKKQ